MSRFNATAAGLVLLALVAIVVPVSADLVTFAFTAELTSVLDADGVLDGAVATGDEVTGQFVLETSTPDGSSSPVIGYYVNAIESVMGSVGGFVFEGPGLGAGLTTVRVVDPNPYRFDISEYVYFLGGQGAFSLYLQDSTRSWTTGDALPSVPYPRFDSSGFHLEVQSPHGFVRLQGMVASFTPEPGALILLASGAMTLTWRKRRRRTTPPQRVHRAKGRVASRFFVLFSRLWDSPSRHPLGRSAAAWTSCSWLTRQAA